MNWPALIILILVCSSASCCGRWTDDGSRSQIPELWGGTQSAALALMVARGDMPKVDAVIFADTQGELPETYAYAEYVKEALVAVDIPFITVTAGSLEQALLSPTPTSHNPTPPAHVLNPDGTHGRIRQYRCSYDFKRRIITREAKRLCGKPGAWKRMSVEQWIGFSSDEVSRVKPDLECCCHSKDHHFDPEKVDAHSIKCKCVGYEPWRINHHPLIEVGWKRQDTIDWFAANGHPTPPRSACFFCPNSSNERWRLLKIEHPDLWERACHLDEINRNGGGFNARGNLPFAGKLYWHRSMVPLREADLRSERQILESRGVFTLFDDDEISMACQGESCFT